TNTPTNTPTPCGSETHPCCGFICNSPDLVCSAGTCVHCGRQNELCCGANCANPIGASGCAAQVVSCEPPLVCTGSVCMVPSPSPSQTPTSTPTNPPSQTPTATSTASPTTTPPPIGCRVTAGGVSPGSLADISSANFGGQVGAPCGCVGCSDS